MNEEINIKGDRFSIEIEQRDGKWGYNVQGHNWGRISPCTYDHKQDCIDQVKEHIEKMIYDQRGGGLADPDLARTMMAHLNQALAPKQLSLIED